MELRHLSILRDTSISYYRKIIPPPLAPTLQASKIRLPFSCICCSVCLQSRETFRLSENVPEFIPHILPWMPPWMAVWNALDLHMQCIYFAVCASWGYWHIEHVTNNGISSPSPATTGCNGHVFWFLRMLNTSGSIPSQHQAPKLDCRPLWRFVYLPSLSSPSAKKEPVNRSLLPPPQKWLSKPASRMEKLPSLLLASTVGSSWAFLKRQALSGFMLQSLVLDIIVIAEKSLSLYIFMQRDLNRFIFWKITFRVQKS